MIGFIANGGVRDVHVPADERLPKGKRELGQMLLDNWPEWRAQVTFPILGKALDWIVRKEGALDMVVLVASDQDDPTFRANDTIHLAELIRQNIIEAHAWASEANIILKRVRGNPSDYDVMLGTYEDIMLGAGEDLPQGRVYLELSGGTPAMVSMLMLKGVERFGERAVPIYVTENRAMPMSLNIGARLTLDATLDDLRRSIDVYQYHAALAVLDSRAELLAEHLPTYQALHAVVDYARQRRNFNFQAAQATVFGADRGLSPDHATLLRDLGDDIQLCDDVWLLREVLATAEVAFQVGAYADFLGRAFRLSEGISDYVIDQWAPREMFEIEESTSLDGCPRVRKMRISRTWLNAHPDVAAHLTDKGIDLNKGVTRLTLATVADYYAGSDNERRRIVKLLNKVAALGDYRNQMPYAHGYMGVSLEGLAQQYHTKKPEQIIKELRELYRKAIGEDDAENPYDVINRICYALIEED
ncbi:MAG: hypothetical protein ACLFTK_17405 [Anaerolineales bacterium]